MVFRVNFLTVWIVLNGLYAVLVDTYASRPVDKSKPYKINDGKMDFL